MEINDIKTPKDIYDFLEENITYGWLDINKERHENSMKDFRRIYRTMSIEETIENKLGTCIEQVYLMKYLLDKINIPSRMFCTRIYEKDEYDNYEEEEHMHCFILYFLDNKVYQLEHPNNEKKGIYEYDNLNDAIKNINEYYINLVDGKPRPVTEFFEVEKGLSFQDFNKYINHIGEEIDYENNSKKR